MATPSAVSLQDMASQLACESDTAYILPGIAVLTSFTGVVLWKHFRSRYPCLTVSDLDDKEQSLDDLYYKRAPMFKQLPTYSVELVDVSRRRIVLKNRASRIRARSLELDGTSTSIWKIYLGFYPKIVPEMVTCYKVMESLERDIKSITESITQYQFEAQLATLGLESNRDE